MRISQVKVCVLYRQLLIVQSSHRAGILCPWVSSYSESLSQAVNGESPRKEDEFGRKRIE